MSRADAPAGSVNSGNKLRAKLVLFPFPFHLATVPSSSGFRRSTYNGVDRSSPNEPSRSYMRLPRHPYSSLWPMLNRVRGKSRISQRTQLSRRPACSGGVLSWCLVMRGASSMMDLTITAPSTTSCPHVSLLHSASCGLRFLDGGC